MPALLLRSNQVSAIKNSKNRYKAIYRSPLYYSFGAAKVRKIFKCRKKNLQKYEKKSAIVEQKIFKCYAKNLRFVLITKLLNGCYTSLYDAAKLLLMR